MEDYRFGVKREQLFRADGTDTQYDALSREGDGHQLSVVSRGYQLVTHAEAMDFLFDQLGGFKHETIGVDLTNEGKRMRYELAFPEYNFTIPGDESSGVPTVKAWNSLDKSRSFMVEFGTLRLVCSNGMTVGHNILQISQTHYMGQIDFEEIGPRIGEAIESVIEDYIGTTERLMQEDAKKYMSGLLRSFPVLFLNMAALDLEEFFDFTYKTVGGIEKPIDWRVKRELDAYQLWQVLTAIVTHRVVGVAKRQKLDHLVAGLMETH